MDDHYLTLKQPSSVEHKIKGSRFIGESCDVQTILEAQEKLGDIRKREHAASHHCYAWRIGPVEVQFKYSDDGEPGGTAGRPIFDIIWGRELTNVLLVVTRYFGGTKLGTGGLARAYGETARMVLEESGVKENFLMSHVRVELDFSFYDQIKKLCHRLSASQRRADFSDRVVLELSIRRSRSEELSKAILELTGGRAKIGEAVEND